MTRLCTTRPKRCLRSPSSQGSSANCRMDCDQVTSIGGAQVSLPTITPSRTASPGRRHPDPWNRRTARNTRQYWTCMTLPWFRPLTSPRVGRRTSILPQVRGRRRAGRIPPSHLKDTECPYPRSAPRCQRRKRLRCDALETRYTVENVEGKFSNPTFQTRTSGNCSNHCGCTSQVPPYARCDSAEDRNNGEIRFQQAVEPSSRQQVELLPQGTNDSQSPGKHDPPTSPRPPPLKVTP